MSIFNKSEYLYACFFYLCSLRNVVSDIMSGSTIITPLLVILTDTHKRFCLAFQ